MLYGCALLCAFESWKGRERKGDRHSCIILLEMERTRHVQMKVRDQSNCVAEAFSVRQRIVLE